jgi:hypothetical protein
MILSIFKSEVPFRAVGVGGKTPHSSLALFSEKPQKRTVQVSLSAKPRHEPKGWRVFCGEAAKNVKARLLGKIFQIRNNIHQLSNDANT